MLSSPTRQLDTPVYRTSSADTGRYSQRDQGHRGQVHHELAPDPSHRHSSYHRDSDQDHGRRSSSSRHRVSGQGDGHQDSRSTSGHESSHQDQASGHRKRIHHSKDSTSKRGHRSRRSSSRSPHSRERSKRSHQGRSPGPSKESRSSRQEGRGAKDDPPSKRHRDSSPSSRPYTSTPSRRRGPTPSRARSRSRSPRGRTPDSWRYHSPLEDAYNYYRQSWDYYNYYRDSSYYQTQSPPYGWEGLPCGQSRTSHTLARPPSPDPDLARQFDEAETDLFPSRNQDRARSDPPPPTAGTSPAPEAPLPDDPATQGVPLPTKGGEPDSDPSSPALQTMPGSGSDSESESEGAQDSCRDFIEPLERWADIVNYAERLFGEQHNFEPSPAKKRPRVTDDTGLLQTPEADPTRRLPLYPTIVEALENLRSELLDPRPQGSKDAAPMLPGKYPVPERMVPTLREDLPPRGRSHFIFPSRKDQGMANLLPPGKPSLKDPSLTVNDQDLIRMEEDQRVLISLLSMSMWSSKVMAKLVRHRQEEEEEGEQDPLMDQLTTLISSQRATFLSMVDRLVVDLATTTLRRRDGFLTQFDKSLPQSQVLQLRHASFLSDRLFDGQTREAADLLQQLKEKSAVGDGLKAMAEATRKQTAALTKAPTSAPGARKSLFAKKPEKQRGRQPFRAASAPSGAGKPKPATGRPGSSGARPPKRPRSGARSSTKPGSKPRTH